LKIKKIIGLILIFTFLTGILPPFEPARANQEETIGRLITVGYYAVWQDPDNPNTFMASPVGENPIRRLSVGPNGSTVNASDIFPSPFAIDTSKYTNIRATAAPVNPEDTKTVEYIEKIYNDPSTRIINGRSLGDFKDKYLRFVPDNYSLTGCTQNSHYDVTVNWNLKLSPILSPTRKAIDLMHRERQNFTVEDYYTDTWSDKEGFKKAESMGLEAYLWALPVVIEWYGTPKSTNPPGGGSTPTPVDPTKYNLSVTGIDLLDSNGSPAWGTLTVGKPYKINVHYKSTFDIPGWAKVSLFYKDSAGNVRQIGDNYYLYFKPGGELACQWNFNPGSTETTIIATINLDWRGDQNFNPLLFEGREESNYDDNKKTGSITASEDVILPPTPQGYTQNLYYHPTKTIQVWVPEVQKVKYIPAPDVKVKTRLIE